MNYFYSGLSDFKRALIMRDTWLYMGFQDIRLRYRRSIIGPWWVTISTALMIVALGFLWSNIFVTQIKTYMPFFAIGYVFWVWISTQISESTVGFTQFEGIIRQTSLPFAVYLFRLSIRNIILLFHNLVIVIFVIFIIGDGFNLNTLYAIPAFLLIQFMLVMLCTTISIFCTRYRDMNQVITVLLQIIFFFSPIIWQPSSLRGHYELLQYNPVFHWMEVIREPLLGNLAPMGSWIFVVINAAFLFIFTTFILGKFRNRISIWL
jgi:hypothetical protein